MLYDQLAQISEDAGVLATDLPELCRIKGSACAKLLKRAKIPIGEVTPAHCHGAAEVIAHARRAMYDRWLADGDTILLDHPSFALLQSTARICGQSVRTAVAWMAANGWTVNEIKTVLERFAVEAGLACITDAVIANRKKNVSIPETSALALWELLT